MKYALSLFIIVLLSACGVDISPLEYRSAPNPTVGYVNASEASEQVIAFVQRGMDLWDGHGLRFEFDDAGEIKIDDDEQDRWLAYFHRNEDGSAQLYFADEDYGWNMDCIMIHYLGLAIGLSDGKTIGLTGTKYLTHDETCTWTEEDKRNINNYIGEID